MNEQRERAELEAVLASALFARAPDLSKILKRVCERRFSNQAGAIEAYSIVVEALGRGPGFRPDEASIVRVQAARLRKHLKRYYETDGARHPLLGFLVRTEPGAAERNRDIAWGPRQDAAGADSLLQSFVP